MKKIHFLILTIALLAGSIKASAAYRSVVFLRHDGTSLTVSIEDDLKAVLNNGNIYVTCSKGEFSMPVVECNKWMFNNDQCSDDIWTAVDNIPSSKVHLVREANRLVLRGVKEGEEIKLTTINGMVIVSGQSIADTDFVIELTDVVPGVYIVSYGKHSVKVTIR